MGRLPIEQQDGISAGKLPLARQASPSRHPRPSARLLSRGCKRTSEVSFVERHDCTCGLIGLVFMFGLTAIEGAVSAGFGCSPVRISGACGPARRKIDRHPVSLPLPVHRPEQKLETDLQRHRQNALAFPPVESLTWIHRLSGALPDFRIVLTTA